MAARKGGPCSGTGDKKHDNRKDEEDYKEEEESCGSTHKTGWEKLVENFGGETYQTSEHKSGGDSYKSKHK